MFLIENQHDLDLHLKHLQTAKILAIDTEFERRNTYFAKLSLVQIATIDNVYLIDVLANLNLQAFEEILKNKEIVKIFHAPQQDLEIFWHKFKILTQNIFDTQIAASLLGFGPAISYDDLCFKICGINIDKTHQTSDWLLRPISQSQLEYAAGDVTYLLKLYDILHSKLMENGKLHDYNLAISKYLKEDTFKINYANAWKKVRFHERGQSFIMIMQHLSAFREECAVHLDVPRKYIATDQELIALCKNLPITNRHLDKLTLESGYLRQGKYRKKLLELCISLKEIAE